jgi:predicted RNase H-like HicB family nuclease
VKLPLRTGGPDNPATVNDADGCWVADCPDPETAEGVVRLAAEREELLAAVTVVIDVHGQDHGGEIWYAEAVSAAVDRTLIPAVQKAGARP